MNNREKKWRFQAGSWKQKEESNRQIFKSMDDLAEMNYVSYQCLLKWTQE